MTAAVSTQMGNGTLITVSERALDEIRTIVAAENPGPDAGVRVAVIGGGCSGMSHEMELSEERPNDNVIPLAADPDCSPAYLVLGRALEAVADTNSALETYRIGVNAAVRRGDLATAKRMQKRLGVLTD